MVNTVSVSNSSDHGSSSSSESSMAAGQQRKPKKARAAGGSRGSGSGRGRGSSLGASRCPLSSVEPSAPHSASGQGGRGASASALGQACRIAARPTSPTGGAGGSVASAEPPTQVFTVPGDGEEAAQAALLNVRNFDLMAFWQDKVSIKDWNSLRKAATDTSEGRPELSEAVETAEGAVMVMRKLKERGLTASAGCEVVLEHREVFAGWPQALSESILTMIIKRAATDEECNTGVHLLRGESGDVRDAGPLAVAAKALTKEQCAKLQKRLFSHWLDARKAKANGKASRIVAALPEDLGPLTASSEQLADVEFVGGWCREMRIDALILRACALIEETGLPALSNVERESLGPLVAQMQHGSLRVRLLLKVPEMAATWAQVTRASREVLDGKALMQKVHDVKQVADEAMAAVDDEMSNEDVENMQQILRKVETGSVIRLLLDLQTMGKRGVELAAEGENKLQECVSTVLEKANGLVDWPVLEQVADAWHEPRTNENFWRKDGDSVRWQCTLARLACQMMATFDDGNGLGYTWLSDCLRLWETARVPEHEEQEGNAVVIGAHMVWPSYDMPSMLLIRDVLSRRPALGTAASHTFLAKMAGSTEKVLSAIDDATDTAIGTVANQLYNNEEVAELDEPSAESLEARFSTELTAEVNKLFPAPWPRLARELARWRVLPTLKAKVKQVAAICGTADGSLTIQNLQAHLKSAILIRSGQVGDLAIVGAQAGEDAARVIDALKSAVEAISDKYKSDVASMDAFLKDTESVRSAITLWSFDGVEEWFEPDSEEQRYITDAAGLVRAADSVKEHFDGLRALTFPQAASGPEKAASGQEQAWASFTQACAGLASLGQPVQDRRNLVAKTVAMMMTTDVVRGAHRAECLSDDIKDTEQYISEVLHGVSQADFPDMLVSKLREAREQGKRGQRRPRSRPPSLRTRRPRPLARRRGK